MMGFALDNEITDNNVPNGISGTSTIIEFILLHTLEDIHGKQVITHHNEIDQSHTIGCLVIRWTHNMATIIKVSINKYHGSNTFPIFPRA